MQKKLKKNSNQLNFKAVNGWGGKRKGAGRTNLSHQVNHMPRPRVSLKIPLHITLRLNEKLPSLRNKVLFNEFKKSLAGAKEFGLYVLHFSIQSNHIHLLAEARDNKALSLGMRALAGRFAKIIRMYSAARELKSKDDVMTAYERKAYARKGSVFKGRYHLHLLKTPTEMKNALEYVLLNLSKHQKLIEYVDHFSSGAFFTEWKALLGKRFQSLIKSDAEFFKRKNTLENFKYHEHFLSPPRSWLAKLGWLRAAG